MNTPSTRGSVMYICGVVLVVAMLTLSIAFAVLALVRDRDIGVVVAFIGSMSATSISFVGIVIKEQADSRRAELSAREARRLEVESGMKAAALLSAHDGSPANPATTSGALLALVQLGEIELATTMMVDLWRERRISAQTGVLIADRALRSDHLGAQNTAAISLRNNFTTLTMRTDRTRDYLWPSCVNQRWLPNLPAGTKRHLVMGWSRLWITDQNYYTALRPQILVAGLYAMWQQETDPVLRSFADRTIRAVMTDRDDQTFVRATRYVNDRVTEIDETLIADLGINRAPRVVLTDELEQMVTWVEMWADGAGVPLTLDVDGDRPAAH